MSDDLDDFTTHFVVGNYGELPPEKSPRGCVQLFWWLVALLGMVLAYSLM